MRLAIQKSNAKTQEERTMIHAEKTIIAQTYRGTCHAQKPCRRGSGGDHGRGRRSNKGGIGRNGRMELINGSLAGVKRTGIVKSKPLAC